MTQHATRNNAAHIGLLAVLLAAAGLAGCTTTTATTAKTICAPWRPITYSGVRDTPATVRQIRVHNTTGTNLRCPNWGVAK